MQEKHRTSTTNFWVSDNAGADNVLGSVLDCDKFKRNFINFLRREIQENE